jgi:aldehyde:ferredoxin oxidoreductase
MTPLTTTTLKALTYQRRDVDKGYTDQYLDVDLSATDRSPLVPLKRRSRKPSSVERDFDLWLLWHAVSGENKWNDPQNAVCISSGPMGGTPAYPGSGKSIVTSISPTTGSVIDSNVGGYFGPYLKFSGFDALRITGKSEGDAVLYHRRHRRNG